MAITHIYLQLSFGASTSTIGDNQTSLHDLGPTLEAWEREAEARQIWKEPKKRIPVSTVQVIRKYEKRFIGRKFPVGGPKK
uniref:Uncharacterized protein n=1 Tax=viral metagenome TaxID=1070528 RepID=A0A6M3JX05_9ZZZZ